MIPTLFGILLITFVIIQFVPGGPVEQIINSLKSGGHMGEVSAGGQSSLYRGSVGLDDDRIKELKALYGFDKPAYERFFIMVGHYLTFDLGNSYTHQKSVTELIIDKLPVSITLGMWTFLLTYLISIPLGISKAIHSGQSFDVVSTIVILVGSAIPAFVLGILLLVLLGGGTFWSVFPLRGLVSDHWDELLFWDKILDYLWHITLPITTMVAGSFAMITLLTKNSFVEEIRKQYVLTARAKGLSDTAILYKHVFRNAMIPLATGFPSAFISAFFGGSILIESLFSLDGLGFLSYESVIKRDYPVIMGTLYIFTLMGLVARLLSDVSYVIIDKRIQFGAIDQ
jgi:microcin C transport system permease protein